MIRWLDFNDTWLAAEWGHPSDNLGGIFGKKSATNGSKSILVSGNMDEVGFLVTKIDKDGCLILKRIDDE